MAFKIKNMYPDSHILDLNLMGIEKRRFKFSFGEIMLLSTPLLTAAILIASAIIPEMSFFAECKNIPGGDICHIALK